MEEPQNSQPSPVSLPEGSLILPSPCAPRGAGVAFLFVWHKRVMEMDVVVVIALSNTVKVYTDNVADAAQLEELLGQRGYEPAGATLWLQVLPTPARAVAEANHLARTLRRRGYRVVTRLL
jgi:hypothetical protein